MCDFVIIKSWIVPPAILFLKEITTQDSIVFEFGSGRIANELTPYFSNIIAIDPFEKPYFHHPQIEYWKCPFVEFTYASHSFGLILFFTSSIPPKPLPLGGGEILTT